MALQARAEATRRRILDSAVDLFDELGYGETGLADVLQRAGVSKGAFYYHFDSKEAVATAVIEDYRRRNSEAVLAAVDLSSSLLERIIVASFTSAAILRSETAARVGNELLQALGQVSSISTRIYDEWTKEFTHNLTRALGEVEVRDGVDAAECAKATWAGVLGSHLLSSALEDEPYSRLAAGWGFMLRVALPEQSLGHYQDLLARLSKGLSVEALR
jgi:AcrR family transcriptional regulator